MIKVGLLGAPNAGKSTLFNALTGCEVVTADYPFSTIETNRAAVDVADQEFVRLGEAVKAQDHKYSQIEFWDIAGLIEGASQGSGLGNEFLGQLKVCDALIHVVRDADNADWNEASVLRELALFDHALLQNPYQKNRHLARVYPNKPEYVRRDKVISWAFNITKEGRVPDLTLLEKDDSEVLKDIGLISVKPILRIRNHGESGRILDLSQLNDTGLVYINAEELKDINYFTNDELEQLDIKPLNIKRLLSVFFDVVLERVHYKRFYTIGHLGVGQWVVEEKSNAQDCARRLHEDFLADRVSATSHKNILESKSWETAQKNGKVTLYSAKKYIPRDRDVLQFAE